MAELTLVGLRVMQEVARRGSFSAAAERLGYTQSAVSRQVALMEKAVGRALFERHARGVRLTAAGAALVRRADTVLAELEGARQDLDDLGMRQPGRLRIGAFSTAMGSLVPRAMAAFYLRQPQTQVLLREGTSDRLLARVADGRLDLAVVTAPAVSPEGVDVIALLEDHLLVAVGRAHRLASRTSVPADELREERWVAGSTEARSTLLGAWSGSGWEAEVVYVVRDWTAKLGLVAAGLGVTVVPGLALPSLPGTIAAVRIDHPAARRTTAIAASVRGSRDPRWQGFSEELHDAAAELAAEIRRRVRD
jgi:DNA-binding transcriptional LysR family regulator